MFEPLASWENLLLAYRKASRGKRGQPGVAAFEHRLEDNLITLRRELLGGSYQPGAYSSFHIHEPKQRLISAAPFRDRVVHHALVNLIEPLFERGFITDTYANRKGKGTHRALDRCQFYARRFPYVLQVDVRQFFPSIDHAILQEILASRIADQAALHLIRLILESGEGVLDGEYDMVYFPGDDLFAGLRPRGLPIGNLTSQFWGNVYLSAVDHFIRRDLRCPGYIRYVDDLLLFSGNKMWLWEAKRQVQQRLAALRLTIHPGAQPRPVEEGIPFLGFVTYPCQRRLKRRTGIHFRRRLRNLARAIGQGTASPHQLAVSSRGWCEHVRRANTVGLRKALAGSLAADEKGISPADSSWRFRWPNRHRD